jgi:hypothetical protein
MFDSNTMKKKVKEWIKTHPSGSEKDLQDYCEALIPPQQYQGHKWLVEQTLSWYRYILENRRKDKAMEDDEAYEGLD